MQQYLDILGLTAKDKATGFAGVCTSVTFLLDGHVLVALSPAIDVTGKLRQPQAFDHARLEITNHVATIPAPDWSAIAASDAQTTQERLASGRRAG